MSEELVGDEARGEHGGNDSDTDSNRADPQRVDEREAKNVALRCADSGNRKPLGVVHRAWE
ncbi:MAG TPA: hypothetical protein VGM82_03720 [Gemmatimonadaceae bacterium]